jgi:hypothetical protein
MLFIANHFFVDSYMINIRMAEVSSELDFGAAGAVL